MKISNFVNRKNRVLLAELVRTDFKLRYENSALGYLWSVLNPLMMFAVLYVIFTKFLGIGRGVDNFPVYLLTGIVLWRFFTEATNNGLRAIVQRGGLIRKINFPKYIIVISGTISSLINLAINLVIVGVFMLISGIGPSWYILLALLPILELYILALGVAFLLSAVNVFLRDIANLWEVVLQAAFYAVPIVYPIGMILEQSELGGKILLMNPVAQVIQDVRYALLSRDTITIWSLDGPLLYKVVPLAVVAIVVIVGGLYFRSKSSTFAERV